MKKLIILVVTILAFQFQADAQINAAFGFKLGMVNSQFKGDDLATIKNIENLKGYNGGVFFNISGKFIGLQPEIIFTQKGSSYELGLSNVDFKISYLEVPVLIKGYVPLKIIKPNVFIGPYIAGRFSQEVSVGDVTLEQVEENIFDYGVVFGGGIDLYPTSHLMLTADIRYDYGLSDIKDNDGDPLKVKNGSLIYNFGLGFRF